MDFWFHTKAIIYSQEGKILVQQRTDTGKWDLPGGRTEIPERIEDAIIREIKEETGIEDITKLDIIYLESDFDIKKDQYFVLIIFKGITPYMEVKLSSEHQNYSWVNKDELLNLSMSNFLKESLLKVTNLF